MEKKVDTTQTYCSKHFILVREGSKEDDIESL